MAASEAKNEQMITALARGLSAAAAARQCGCSERTVRRRLAEDDFREKVAARRAELVQGAVGRLAGSGRKAVRTLGKLLGSESDTVRLGASRAVLEYLFRGAEIDVLAGQVEDLRRQLAALEATKREPANDTQTAGRLAGAARRPASGAG